MRSTWLGLAFSRFRCLSDFQESSKCNSYFVTISNNIQVKCCRLDPWMTDNLIASANLSLRLQACKLSLRLETCKLSLQTCKLSLRLQTCLVNKKE